MTRNGGRTIDEREREVIDLIAERLGGAFSIPSTWRVMDRCGSPVDDNEATDWIRSDDPGEKDFSVRSSRDSEYLGDDCQHLAVQWRDRRRPMRDGYVTRKDDDEEDDADPAEEKGVIQPGTTEKERAKLAKVADKILRKDKFKRPHKWMHSNYQIAPRARRDPDALGAVGFAKLAAPYEAIWMLYATGDVPRYWATVRQYGLGGCTDPANIHAITDAMQVILFRKAEKSQDNRARSLGLRASAYRALRANYLGLLWGWIRSAANSYSRSLTGLSIRQVLAIRDREDSCPVDGRATTRPSTKASPAPLQTTVISSAEPANDDLGQGTQPPIKYSRNSSKGR